MTAGQFLEIFVSVSLQVGLFVLMCTCISRRISCDLARMRLWTNCHYGLLILLVVASTLPHLRLIHGSETQTHLQILQTVTVQNRVGITLAILWGSGALVSLLFLVQAGGRTLKTLRSLKPLDRNQLPVPADLLSKPELQNIRFLVGNSFSSPFCWQFQQPVMVLPASFLTLEKQELEQILRHEMGHLHFNHPLHLFLQRLIQSLFWYHPAVYWAGRQADLAREMVCDRVAASSHSEIASYLRVLLKVVEFPLQQPAASLGLPFFYQADAGSLTLRARRLVERAAQKEKPGSGRVWNVASIWVLLTLMTLVWVPVNALSSRRSLWSACPNWTAEVLHDFGVSTRDYEVYEGRLQLHDDEPPHRAQAYLPAN